MTSDSLSPQITNAIPHRPPMLLVDQIVQKTADTIKCLKTFRLEEYFTQGHFPDFPIVPGVILCECALQAGAILLSERLEKSGNYVPIATRLDNVKFKQMVRPGDSIEIDVTLNEVISNAFFMTGKITVAGKIAAPPGFCLFNCRKTISLWHLKPVLTLLRRPLS